MFQWPFTPQVMAQIADDAFSDWGFLGNLEGHKDGTYRIVWSPDDSVLVSSGAANETIVWDIENHSIIRILNATDNAELAMDPMGRFLAVEHNQSRIAVYDIQSWTPVQFLSKQNETTDLSFSPDGEVLGCASGFNLYVWNTTDWNLGQNISFNHQLNKIAFSPDSPNLALGTSNYTEANIYIVNTASWSISANHTYDRRLTDLEYSPNGSYLFLKQHDRT